MEKDEQPLGMTLRVKRAWPSVAATESAISDIQAVILESMEPNHAVTLEKVPAVSGSAVIKGRRNSVVLFPLSRNCCGKRR